MKIVLLILLTINMLFAKDYNYVASCGFLSEGTLLSKFKEARIALKSWVEDLIEADGGKVNVFFYDDNKKIYEDLKNEKLNMIVIGAPFFFENREDIYTSSKDYWSLDFGSGKFNYYYLISNKKNKNYGFKNLLGKTLILKENDQIAKIWLEKKSYEINKKNPEKVLNNIIYEEKDSSLILNVYFNKADYAIVKKNSLG